MQQFWSFVCACVMVALGCSEIVPGTCYENPAGGAGGGGSIPTTSVGATSGTGDFPADPEKEPQDSADPPAGCVMPPGPCEAKCVKDYDAAAIKCGKIEDDAQRRACQDAAFAKYWSCHESCEQKSHNTCQEKWERCTNYAPWPCAKKGSGGGGKSMCNVCWEQCNAGNPTSPDCKTCLF